MQNANADFGQRSGLALTHPVTLAALGVLLLNDLVFKSLWVNPWTTGKTQRPGVGGIRLAAAGMDAFTGSAEQPSGRKGGVCGRLRRAAAALRGVQHLCASARCDYWGDCRCYPAVSAGSPLDPTDSLVIPAGLVIALWVWRRSGENGTREWRDRKAAAAPSYCWPPRWPMIASVAHLILRS